MENEATHMAPSEAEDFQRWITEQAKILTREEMQHVRNMAEWQAAYFRNLREAGWPHEPLDPPTPPPTPEEFRRMHAEGLTRASQLRKMRGWSARPGSS